MLAHIHVTGAAPGCPPNAVNNARIALTVVGGKNLVVAGYKELEALVQSNNWSSTVDMEWEIKSPGCKTISSWAYNVPSLGLITRYYSYTLEPV